MSTATAWHSGVASDLGLRRTVNEDRVMADDARGVFLVVDGLGGHAAGEIAAEAAVRAIQERMRSLTVRSNAEALIRQAITDANNRIVELAESHSEWQGMACVLTLAVVQEDRVTVGHVGDSRLYLLWNGQLKKLTSDHSPVGEQEDAGVLTEEEAMKHPRRNEVFRDVGSCRRTPDDLQFIETNSFLFRPDAALLLTSDGLSDFVPSAEISRIMERYDGAPEKIAEQLIGAANAAGGHDNISVVFVPGPEFLGSHSQRLIETRPRHAITRSRMDESGWRALIRNLAWLLVGIALGIASPYVLARWYPKHNPSALINPADSRSIQKALQTALPGDTIEVPAGDYLGPLELRDHVDVQAKIPGRVTLRSDPGAVNDGGIAIVARRVRTARVEGLRVVADETHPLRTGVLIENSSAEIANLDISGASESGIQIAQKSKPILLANFIHANSGAGVIIRKDTTPRLVGNWIVENGKLPVSLRPGIEVESGARPDLSNNTIARNGVLETVIQ